MKKTYQIVTLLTVSVIFSVLSLTLCSILLYNVWSWGMDTVTGYRMTLPVAGSLVIFVAIVKTFFTSPKPAENKGSDFMESLTVLVGIGLTKLINLCLAYLAAYLTSCLVS